MLWVHTGGPRQNNPYAPRSDIAGCRRTPWLFHWCRLDYPALQFMHAHAGTRLKAGFCRFRKRQSALETRFEGEAFRFRFFDGLLLRRHAAALFRVISRSSARSRRTTALPYWLCRSTAKSVARSSSRNQCCCRQPKRTNRLYVSLVIPSGRMTYLPPEKINCSFALRTEAPGTAPQTCGRNGDPAFFSQVVFAREINTWIASPSTSISCASSGSIPN